MLKQTVSYTDYNDVAQTAELYFNLTRTEMVDLLEWLPRMQAFAAAVANRTTDLSTEEIKEMLAIFKNLIKLSYGERSEDGKYFRKTPEIYENFAQSAVYDAFVFGLFDEPENANKFMTGVMPQNLIAEAEKELAAQVKSVNGNAPAQELTAVQEEVPAWIREDRDPTQAETRTMTREQLLDAMKRKSAKK